jgi:transposase InsO family protein
MRGLVPELRNMNQWPRSRRVPQSIVQEVLRLKGMHQGLSSTEIARIVFITKAYPIHHNTVKEILRRHPVPAQGRLALLDYHDIPDRYQARLQVVKLFYQGWGKQSIRELMHVSRPTIDDILTRFEEKHFAGLMDRKRGPKHPARKVDLSLMVRIYHLQKEHPDAGEFRIWSLLGREDISRTTVGRIMAINRLVYDDIPHVVKPGAKKPPAPHPFKALYPHHYWFIDGRQMDFEIDGQKWWSLCILDGYSRTILAGAIAPAEAGWVALMVLYTACLRYGGPENLVSDSGGAYLSNEFQAVCARLGITHHPIESSKGESYKNWIETHFNIQRRLYDYKFSLAQTVAEFERLHEEFIQVYNTTAHQGLLEEGFHPPIPLTVLGSVRGKVYTEEELNRKFYCYLFPRTTNVYGCVTLHSYHFYVEEGLPRKKVLLWVYGDTLRAEFENVVLAEYRCRYDWKEQKVKDVREPVLHPTRFISLQGDLIPLSEQELAVVYRPRAQRRRRKAGPQPRSLVLFELVA